MLLPTRLLLSAFAPPTLAALGLAIFPTTSSGHAALVFALTLILGGAAAIWQFRHDPDISHSEEKFHRVFDFSPDYMIVGRLADGKIVNANSSFSRMTGYSLAEAIGKTTHDLHLWLNPTERSAFLERLRREGTVHEAPTQMQRHDGQIIDVLSSATIFTLDGIDYYVAIVRDITETRRIQAQLSASEARLKTIIEASPTPIVLNRLDDFTLIDVNPAWEALYGAPRQEALGKTIRQCGMICATPALLREQTQELLAKGRIDAAEASFMTAQGRRVSIIYSSRIIELDGEKVMVSINTDISQLKETESRLKAIVDAAPVPITITRLGNHSYLQVNREFERMVGQPESAILGKNLRQVGFIPADPDRLSEQTARLLASRLLDNEQMEFLTPQGRRLTLMYSSRIIELDGEPAIISIASDITQLKEVEEGLRRAEAARIESEARFVALFQSSPVPMAVFNATGQRYEMTELNTAWYQTFGYTPEQAIGHNTADAGFWVDNADREKILRTVEKEGDVSDFECWLRRADNRRLFCSVSCSLIDFGDHSLLIAAYLDITERHRVEEEIKHLNSHLETHIRERTRELQQAQANLLQSEKLASLGSLVAGVAHEINTPIGNSMSVATTLAEHAQTMQQLLQGGMKRSALENFLNDTVAGTDILTRNLQRASSLILSFKSIAIDQASDQRRRFDLREVIEETLIALHPSLKKKPYQVINDIAPDLILDSYPGPLEQVVVNFINNAMLHAFDGRDSGSLHIGGEALGEDWVLLSVRDDGVGISPENLPRIFDPYFTTKLGAGGSGLGLHIVRQIVERELGGKLTVRSQLGEGTTMAVELPRRAPERQTTPVAG